MNPKDTVKREFGQRVSQLSKQKGWTQSELARQCDLPRDRVSTYVRGLAIPSHKNLNALAVALNVDPKDLLSNPSMLEIDNTNSATEQDNPAFHLRVSSDEPGKAWLRVNRSVSFATGVKIAALLEADNAMCASANGG